MRTGLLIIIQLLILHNVCTKDIKIEKNINYINSEKYELFKNFMIEESKERSIKNIWVNIKNSVQNAWNNLKGLVQNTKEKIKSWVQNVKERAVAITKSFEERLKELKKKINSTIQDILADEDIKKCFEDERETFDKILRKTVTQVADCISKKIKGLTVLEDYQKLDTMMNDTQFMENVDARLILCNQKEDDSEECFRKVKEDILKETEEMEDEVLKTRLIARYYADDILDAVITCSTDGLIQASAAITNVIMSILKCIAQIKP